MADSADSNEPADSPDVDAASATAIEGTGRGRTAAASPRARAGSGVRRARFDLRPSRRAVLVGAWASGAAALAAACSSGAGPSTGSSAAAENALQGATESFPITIKHTYGSTTIASEPTRIAAISTVDADVVISLGLVPAGVPAVDAAGDDAYPWTVEGLDALGADVGTDAAPAVYDDLDEFDVEAMADLEPDLILGVHSGMSEQEYRRLSAIAPTLAYPADAVAYEASWEAVTVAVGRALGRSAAAEALVNTTTDVLTSTITANPILRGATYAAVSIDVSGPSITLYTESDTRSQVLWQLGLTPAPVVARAGQDADDVAVSFPLADAAQLTADLLWVQVGDTDAVESIKTDPRLATIPAVAAGTALFVTDTMAAASLKAASPLSLPWCCEHHVPDIAAAVETSRAVATASATAVGSAAASPAASSTAP